MITVSEEATAIGKLNSQMLAMGDIQLLEEGRAIIRDSFAPEFRTFEPQDSKVWKEALVKWRSVCRLSEMPEHDSSANPDDQDERFEKTTR